MKYLIDKIWLKVIYNDKLGFLIGYMILYYKIYLFNGGFIKIFIFN